MSEGSVLQIVVLVGWLALVVTGYRNWRVSRGKTLAMALVWLVIFGIAALIFGAIS
ncbi:hypothetical protein [Aurantiacibacter suaedae]|uniref:hypothetical protein n=1 Tax=Aurantiacibacter suaedae TaxID=2545755 RepID=UPI001386923D|nr:hypothetical protein [Aurantiacibacter suaedae]